MYIVGHCVITDIAKSSSFDVYGSHSVALMLPDVVRCHDWGYERCFQSRPTSVAGQLIRMHMLEDWFIHYGETTVRERVGWAYRKMAVYAREYDGFFSTAAARGLRHHGEPPDSRRGFSHTMIEYSIDTWLAHKGYFKDHFAGVRDALGSVGCKQGVGSLDWIAQTIDAEDITTSSPDWRADAKSFGDRVRKSGSPEEFVYRAGVKKFGLEECSASIDLVADVISAGLAKIPDDEICRTVNQAARFLSCWFA